MKFPRTSAAIWWTLTTAEGFIVACSVLYVATDALWSLLLWLLLTLSYVIAGFFAASGSSAPADAASDPVLPRRWMWVTPLVAGVTGISSAIFALNSNSSPIGVEQVQAAVASLAVVLSWILLHTGFARIYRNLVAHAGGQGLEFPRTHQPGLLDYLYFSFTIATAFATSDVIVTTSPVRRIVLVHSVISFLYNALVVAIAFQILQTFLKA